MGHRQLRPTQPRLNVEPLVEEIVESIMAGPQDHRLKWDDDGLVEVLVGKIIPEGSAAKQTLSGRRKWLRKALLERLEAEGCGLTA